jgi:hypothetical protein
MRTDRPGNFGLDMAGLVIGSGILLIQACALFPGLLPCLVLLLPFVLPFVVLGAVVSLLVAIPIGAWRLIRRVVSAFSRDDSRVSSPGSHRRARTRPTSA